MVELFDVRSSMKVSSQTCPLLILFLLLANCAFPLYVYGSEAVYAASAHYSIRQERVLLRFNDDSISLTEEMKCVAFADTAGKEKEQEYVAVIRSKPLLFKVAGITKAVFGTQPAAKVSQGKITAIHFVPMGGGMILANNPLGFFEIVVQFIGSVPNEFSAAIDYSKGELVGKGRAELIYRPQQHNRPLLPFGRDSEWGPFRLLVSLDESHRLLSDGLTGKIVDSKELTFRIGDAEEVHLWFERK